MKRLAIIFAGLLAIASNAGDIQYPSGTVTRTYVGGTEGTIAGLPVFATAVVEITATDEAYTHPSGNVFVVRGKFTKTPIYPEAETLTNWSNLIAVHASGDYVRAQAAWGDGGGSIVVSWPADWSLVTAEAVGEVLNIPCSVSRTTLALVQAFTNMPATSTNLETSTSNTVDDIDVAKVKIIGKHGMNPSKAQPTRTLHSVSDMGGNCRLSYDPLGWPTTSAKGKTCDAGVVILWPEGDGYTGGWFDHKKVGQSVKTMENIFGGYVDGKQPPAGSQVWFYLISYDGKQRTNIKAGWIWKGH